MSVRVARDGAGGHLSDGSERPLSAAQVRQRAGAGAVVIGMCSVLVNVLALGGGIVLARLLVPRDFGIVAVGATIATLGTFIAEAGLGASLIRRAEHVERRDLEALLALQLALGGIVAAAIAAIALPFGTVGLLTAVMCTAVPLSAFRTPGMIVLERRLSYAPIALVQIAEMIAYYAWALGTVLAGWGAWGLATAIVARSATAGIAMALVSPVRVLRPRPSWSRTKTLLRFGARFQAVGAMAVVRDQTLNLGIAAFSGFSVLGLWTLARRLLEPGFLLLGALWRVSYPAMSRLIQAGEEPRPVIERALRLVAAGCGVLLVPLVGAGPALVPAVFGSQWTDAATVLPWAGVALMISGPISVAASGYLWAVGDARTPLRATALDAVAWCAVSLSLLPFVGVSALGVGWLTGGILQAAVFAKAIVRRTQAQVSSAVLVPIAAAVAAGAAAWPVTSILAPTLSSAVVGGLLAEGVYLGLLLVLRRELVSELVAVASISLRSSLRPDAVRAEATPAR